MVTPIPIASRMVHIEASGIRRMFEMAQRMTDPIDLSIGQAHFDVPEPVKEAAIQAIRSGFNRYTVTQGIPELRDKIAEKITKRLGVSPGSVMLTCGASGGLFMAYLTTVNPKDEVLIADPYFVMYKHLVHMAGGVPRYVDTYPDFRLTPEKIEAAITKKTKFLTFNNPVNPTGVAYTAEEVKAIADVARKYNLTVISDEVYDHFSYDFPHESTLKYYPEKTILVTAFSKTLGMAGWRIGYVAGPPDVVEQMKLLQQFSYVCPNAPSQKAVLASMDLDLTGLFAEYKTKRDLVVDGLKDQFEIVVPQGAFYLFPKVPWGDDQEFVARALEKSVIVVPGSACSRKKTHFRLSYAVTDEMLKRGIDALNATARAGP